MDANASGKIDAGEAVSLDQVITWQLAKTTPKVKILGDLNYNGPDTLRVHRDRFHNHGREHRDRDPHR